VTATLPGLKPEDIEITIHGEVLRIQGETKKEEEVKNDQFHRRERQFGRFFREVTLPMPVKSEGVDAQFENGVLTLRLPKAEEAKTRRIQVQSGTNRQQGGNVPRIDTHAA
jgi:HSP20 family protein